MAFLLTFTLIFTLRGSSTSYPSTVAAASQQQSSACGIRPIRRQPRVVKESAFYYNDRIPKIIAGSPTREGQFPWQVSLELLHPSMGFLGHWCGGVLIDRYWILSAAHCVHNDLFNLPLPPLWTVVLGEHDRSVESGYEQRIPVEKIVLHQNYHNFLHDLVLMKLSTPADMSWTSNIRKICLPFVFDENTQSSLEQSQPGSHQIDDYGALMEKDDNFLRKVRIRHTNFTLPSMKELLSAKISNLMNRQINVRQGREFPPKRRNDKLMAGFGSEMYEAKHESVQEVKDLPYIDCVATGWGKSNLSGDITEILLKTDVPLHSSSRCREAYGNFVRVHKGHLCAGKLNGKGGTCVGDSGGPLQCRLTKNGPWILAGVTSFGSGCALEGFPDVYTRTSYYMKWIHDTMSND